MIQKKAALTAEYRLAGDNKDGIVLLVEDNPADVTIVRMALAENGVRPEIFVATDGAEGMQLLDDIEAELLPCPDLIVLDLNLPKRTGLEVLQRVRDSPLCGTKPVVILSSADSPKDRREAARAGATDYIKKPFNISELSSIGATLKAFLPG